MVCMHTVCTVLGEVLENMCFSEIKLPVNEEEELLSWEALMKDRYLLSTQQEQSQSMERRIMDTANK